MSYIMSGSHFRILTDKREKVVFTKSGLVSKIENDEKVKVIFYTI